MAPLTGITMIQKFTYRGDTEEEFSNTYHFRDNPPSTSADWLTLATALANELKTVFQPSTKIVRAYGYDTDAAKPISVWSHDWEAEAAPIAGTYVKDATEHDLAGDQAYFMEWQLDHKSTRGKWVYLRKYLHGGTSLLTNPDVPGGNYREACRVLANALGPPGTGFHGGLRARTGTWPVIWSGTSDYITTRTLRRRGKRPPTPP